jgi:hypothetical protein
MLTLVEAIDNIYKDGKGLTDDQAKTLIEISRQNLESSEKQIYRRFLVILIIWLVFFGITKDIFSEVSFLSIKFNDLKSILWILPLPIGAIYYAMLTSIWGWGMYRHTLKCLLKHHYKQFYDGDLEDLMLPPSFLAAELIAAQRLKKGTAKIFIGLWAFALFCMALLVPFMCLAHVSYVTLTYEVGPLWLRLFGVLLSVVISLRGIIFLFANINKTL